MQYHLPLLMGIAISFLMGLIGCAEAPKPSPPMQADSGMSADSGHVVAPAEGTQDQPPPGEVQERAVPRMTPGGVPTFPPTRGPTLSPTRPPIPPPTGGTSAGPKGGLGGVTAPPPTTNAPPPVYVGPTDNLTKVANAIHVSARSLTTAVTVAPGLTLTQPVTISIALGGYGPTRITQTYVASTGNYFWYNDPEGDRKPRRAMVDIALTEPKPGGGFYSYTIPGSVMLDPLYDVTIGPLGFTLFSSCAHVGDSDISLAWTSPDRVEHGVRFSTSEGDHKTINEFAWARAEVSASAHLSQPYMLFSANTFWPCFPGFCFTPGADPSSPTAFPTPTVVFGVSRQVVNSLNDGKDECSASAVYNITYQLRFYPNLGF